MSESPFERLVARLGPFCITIGPSNAEARCPACRSDEWTLKVSVGTANNAIVYCTNRCEERDILAAIGCEHDDLFDADRTASDKGRQRSARDRFVDLAAAEYTTLRGEDSAVYLVPHDGPNVALGSGEAKAHLRNRYHKLYRSAIGRTPSGEAWETIEGKALEVAKCSLPIRVARHGPSVVLDLGTLDGRAVVIDADSWRVVSRSPVTFKRSNALLAMPEPTPGTLAPLFDLLPIAPAGSDLFAAWLTAALFEDLPHPILTLRGAQGGGKSTMSRAVSRLLDPCQADTQRPPGDDEDWLIACTGRWTVCIDNMSNIPPWLSDALCRAVTGEGWVRRLLYTNEEQAVTVFKRVIVLNGITLGGTLRPDLAERLIRFDLHRPTRYLTEREVNGELDAMRPGVLGALCSMASATLGALPSTPVPRDLRMTDFAHLLAAFDAAHGTRALDAYRSQVDDQFAEAFEADPIARAVVLLMTNRYHWEGTASGLLTELHGYRRVMNDASDEHWPSSPSSLSNYMTRASAMLDRLGIAWTPPRQATTVTSDGQRPRICALNRVYGTESQHAGQPDHARP